MHAHLKGGRRGGRRVEGWEEVPEQPSGKDEAQHTHRYPLTQHLFASSSAKNHSIPQAITLLQIGYLEGTGDTGRLPEMSGAR